MNLHSEITLSLCICPNCHCATFSQHHMVEYKHEWNKCPSCSYMELKITTKNRVLNTLAPEQLIEPFVEPLTLKVKQKAMDLRTYCKDVKNSDDTDNTNSDPTTD